MFLLISTSAISIDKREGNLGVRDYYNLKNIEADTGMRNSINKRTNQEDDESPDK